MVLCLLDNLKDKLQCCCMPKDIQFYDYLRCNKVLVVHFVQKGGYLNDVGKSKPVTDPCSLINTQIFSQYFENETFLTIAWNEKLDNGIVEFQMDEKRDDDDGKWWRTLGAGAVTNTDVFLNETDGAEAYLYYVNHELFFNRDRDEGALIGRGFQFNSDHVEVSSIEERDRALGF